MPLLAPEAEVAGEIAQQTLDDFPALYMQEYLEVLRRKLGLATAQQDDETLIQDFLETVQNFVST